MLVLCCLITAALIFAFLRYYRAAQYINLRGKNICITGGSEGKKNVLIVKWKEKYGYMIGFILRLFLFECQKEVVLALIVEFQDCVFYVLDIPPEKVASYLDFMFYILERKAACHALL